MLIPESLGEEQEARKFNFLRIQNAISYVLLSNGPWFTVLDSAVSSPSSSPTASPVPSTSSLPTTSRDAYSAQGSDTNLPGQIGLQSLRVPSKPSSSRRRVLQLMHADNEDDLPRSSKKSKGGGSGWIAR